jgi:hypothetical protein
MVARRWRAALLAVGVLIVFCSFVRTQVFVPATEAVGPVPSVLGTGLNGAWYFDPNNPTRGIPNIAAAQVIIASEQPYSTFNATYMLYNGTGSTGDSTSASQFLTSFFQNDGNTLDPANPDPIQSSIFDMTGYIRIDPSNLDVTFGLNSDDGSAVFIGQSSLQVAINDGTHGTQLRTGEAIFEAPGLYPIEVIYFNQDFTNNGVQHSGGATFYFLGNVGGISGPVSPLLLYPKIP